MKDQSTRSKIENNRLCYIQYHLSDFAILQVYKQISATEGAPPQDRLVDIELDTNGLKDSSAALLFEAVSKSRHLKRLRFKNNEFGVQTAEAIGKMLLWPFPYHLEHLVLHNVKTSLQAMKIFLNYLKKSRGLKTLRLRAIDLNHKDVSEGLMKFLRLNVGNLESL